MSTPHYGLSGPRYMACPVCDGQGWVSGNFWPDDHGKCWECGGSGKVVDLSDVTGTPEPASMCADDEADSLAHEAEWDETNYNGL